MFNKILIANRGEIASRIIRTCKKMGIKSVAIYSEADNQALHVKEADEAFLVGGSRVNESYLNIKKIIEIAKDANVDAIHPGYGFLSENPSFEELCKENGIIFIGPSSEAIQAMGSKIEARKTMEIAKVPIVPGNNTALTSIEEAIEVANQIGYPVMLKASAGGGGIGMARVNNENELLKSFSGNQKRADAFFGDGSMFIEKLIENPRHIEIQILSDKQGHTIYLGERDCSIQRRHQKVVEEAPSSFIDQEIRDKMGQAAVNAAKAIGYCNAGTVEFIMDTNKNFYFLEMNTRLQVEHPVTEEITGLDLVEEQINIAYGLPLELTQENVNLVGHAIEVRIYAEDPKTFFPSPGKITSFKIPIKPYVRHELSVEEGSTVSTFYDPMIAKLIVKGDNRDQAIDELIDSLAEYKVEGIKTNIPLLEKIVQHPEFRNGNATTNFINAYIIEGKVNAH
ncbi:acetyl-CoA carboxylase biotin carboxylase subunit [Cytobacillus kochii]|uniref:acetyl-CoA carboxylase biotin carboxylase subunit n=1 Tax=Cytobacillus kochii TaxID=859143 RepID=UPI002E1EE884|nr:acetyl-CoA carboxylase biotin carboxylase subunit [Cytobacillus kochii]